MDTIRRKRVYFERLYVSKIKALHIAQPDHHRGIHFEV